MEYYRCTKNEYSIYQEHWKVDRIYEFDGDRLTTDASFQNAWFTSVMPPVDLNPNKIHFEKVTPKTRIIACISSSIPGNYEFVKGRIYEYDVNEEKLYCESKNNERDFFLVTNDQTLSDLLNLLSQGYELKDVTDPNGIYFRCIDHQILHYGNQTLFMITLMDVTQKTAIAMELHVIRYNIKTIPWRDLNLKKVELFNDTTSPQQTKHR